MEKTSVNPNLKGSKQKGNILIRETETLTGKKNRITQTNLTIKSAKALS